MWTSILDAPASGPQGQVLGVLDLGRGPVVGAELRLHGVAKTEGSRRLVCLLESVGAAPVVLGELHTYGEGPLGSPLEHSRFAPMELSLEVTEPIRSARALGDRAHLVIRAVGPGAAEPIHVAGVELRVW